MGPKSLQTSFIVISLRTLIHFKFMPSKAIDIYKILTCEWIAIAYLWRFTCKGTIKLGGFEILPFKLPNFYSTFTFLHNSNLVEVLLKVLYGVGCAIFTSQSNPLTFKEQS
jgi:hypothetical protein